MNAAELTANLPPVICGDAVLGEDPSRCKFCREGPLECNCHIPVGNFAALLQDNFVCNSRRQDRDMLRLPRSPIRENKREMAANLRHPEDAVWMLRCHESDDSLLSIPSVMAEVVANRRRELARNDEMRGGGGSASVGRPNARGDDGRDIWDGARKDVPRGVAGEDELEPSCYLEDADDDGDMLDLPTPSKLFAPSPRQRYDRGSTQ